MVFVLIKKTFLHVRNSAATIGFSVLNEPIVLAKNLHAVSPNEISQLQVLQAIKQKLRLSQRELVRQRGVSLGKTYYLEKALIDKGWVKAGNFRRIGDLLCRPCVFLCGDSR